MLKNQSATNKAFQAKMIGICGTMEQIRVFGNFSKKSPEDNTLEMKKKWE